MSKTKFLMPADLSEWRARLITQEDVSSSFVKLECSIIYLCRALRSSSDISTTLVFLASAVPLFHQVFHVHKTLGLVCLASFAWRISMIGGVLDYQNSFSLDYKLKIYT